MSDDTNVKTVNKDGFEQHAVDFEFEAHHEDIIRREYACCLCGTYLELDFVIITLENLIEETAHCPTCDIRARKKLHVLH